MDLEKIIKQPCTTLLDVREEEELINEGEVPGAVLIPMKEIPNRLDEIHKFSTPLIVFCRSGKRSGNVVEYLKSEGFTHLYNGGGFKEVISLLEK